ncbi:MAG TPA: DUF456 domain-containing protein [Tepidisphaeraceae bacterium]|jgi:hypothetical protein|nr:DUF456 domain-containing protein [Tepidisphaeraceae bacterium]
MTAYHIALYLLLLLLSGAGAIITLINLPGLWLIVASLGGYELLTHHQFASWRTLLAMLIAAAVAEYLEITSSGRSARRAGASRRGIWGALLGSIAGGIVCSAFFFPIGTIVGLLGGAFVGALLAEFAGGTNIGTSVKIGASAAGGRFKGLLLKFIFGLGMLTTVAITAFPYHRKVSVTPSMQVAPATTRSATAP